ncbi:hypothetical protein Sme01_08080 [Sphaerisporangium melleum]|uniref:Uncharacterized protein n=1 Tax=Sphaerisporangium melleum TaxID=321316 RepID=A0A917VFX2_9ACTN|nr:hypothetical protein [Sphaerisporangium melleum]GGK72506.1 hypothetical protein GCM10007964_14110 [Sphaerisporangium melleum]GII68332.1 hypothetical protein Sme01_08080 [Sphaerisporangium melleum]
MNRGKSLARSRRGGHRRRKPRSRVVLESCTALAAVTVVGLAAGVVFLRPDDGLAAQGAPQAPPAAMPAPFAPPVWDGAGAGATGEGGAGAKAAGAKAKKARDPDKTASGPSKHTDASAMTYFKRRWEKDKAVKRITDIRTVGKYLRIYTDLPESAHNSKSALDLCKRGMEYLAQEVGDADPVVFVQAEYGQNGNPVLANIIGGGDRSCRLTAPKPR